MHTKKLAGTGELSYVLALLLNALGVAMMTKADFGLSMIVAPAFLISQKIEALSFGGAEYVVQALLLVILFFILHKFEWRYFLTFATAVIYGAILDGFVFLIDAYAIPESIVSRILYYIFGLLICDAGVSLYFTSYLPPCCYNMFVKELSAGLKIDRLKVKIAYDYTSFAIAIILSFIFFGELRGLGIGTLFCVFVNGPLINRFTNLFGEFTDFSPKFPKLHKLIATNTN